MSKRTQSPTYMCWRDMMRRCYDPRRAHYQRWGAKGITVCERWHKFDNFLADMGDKPPGKTLDRKEGAKGYSKSNCRWATTMEQAQNRRTTRRFTHNGKTMTVREHCDLARIEYRLVKGRLKEGWDFHRAITTPRIQK